MKSSWLMLFLLMLLAGAAPASAQYSSGADEGDTCWQCPVCGSVFSLTPLEAASIDAYTPCPACYSAYAGYFSQVSCQEAEQYDQEGEQGYDGQKDAITDDSVNKNPLSALVSANKSLVMDSSSATKEGKILMVLAPQDYQEEELNVPREYFQSRGYEVVLASKGVKTATGMNGEKASIDLDLKNVKLSDFAAVVFVGGEGIYNLKINLDADYQGLAKKAVNSKKLTAAICLGPWILADAGLLNGKKATAAETDHLQSKGAVVTDQAVVRDGSIITANGPDAAQEFAEAVVSALEESGEGEVSDSEQGVSREDLATALRVPLGADADSANQGSAASAAAWKCTVCGYVYDPAEHDGVAFEQLPSAWKCPCGSGKSKFIKT